MFEHLNTPRELFSYKLGSALQMERDILESLGDLEGKANGDQLKQMLRTHAGETQEHIRNIEQAFAAIGEEPDDNTCLVTKALEKETTAEIKKADDGLADAVILSGAGATEHYEIAVYETLITHAQAAGQDAVVTFLRQNLESEQRTLGLVREAEQRIAAQSVARAPA